MNKFKNCLMLGLVICLCCMITIGCAALTKDTSNNSNVARLSSHDVVNGDVLSTMFEVVDSYKVTALVNEDEVIADIVYDKDTGVMYAVSRGPYNQGTFVMLVNADGTPKIYEE